MATLGDTSEPTNSAEAFSNSYNHFGHLLTMPSGGPWRITKAAVWAAGYGASPSAVTAVWRVSDGAVLGNSTSFTLTQRTFTASGSDLYDKALSSPPVVSGGTQIFVGFAISPLTSGAFFGKRASGTYYRKDNTSGFPGDMSGYGSSATGAMGGYITYEAANTAPNAPTLNDPTAGEYVASQTPTLNFTPSDPDGDAHTGYTYQVDNNSDFSSPVESTEVNGSFTNGVAIDRVVSTSLTRGTTYYWRVKTKDATNGYGPYSAGQSFKIGQLPAQTLVDPASAQTAELYYTAGSNTDPKIKARWTFSCPDGHAQNQAIIRIYADSAGSPGSLLNTDTYNGANDNFDTTYAVTEGTYYHVSVQVKCTLDLQAAESTKHRCRVRWGRATYYFDATTTPLTLNAIIDSTVSGDQAMIIEYATHGGGAASEPATWYSSVGAAGLNRWLWHRVTMFGWGSATPTSPKLNSFQWLYSANAITLDFWTMASGAAVDQGTYVYGSQSLKHLCNGAQQDTYQVFSVTQNTNVLAHIKIKTLGDPNAQLLIMDQAGSVVLASVDADPSADWKRYVTPVINTGSATSLRCVLRTNGSAPDAAWFDIGKCEDGTVATPWNPRFLGALRIDAGGIIVDGTLGAIFRFRGSGGGAITMVAHGLRWEGATASSDALELRVLNDADDRFRLDVDGTMRWGNGTDAPDLQLSRSSTDAGVLVLATGDRFEYQSPCCVSTRTTTQSITTSTWTPVDYNSTDVHDPFGFHDPSTNPSRFTVPTGMGGQYLCWASVSFTGNATNTRLLHMSINNSTPNSTERAVQATGDATHQQGMNVLFVQELAAGDYVEFEVWQDSGGNLNVGADAWAGIFYIGNT